MFGAVNQPARPQQRVTGNDRHPGEQRKRRQPIEPTTGIGAAFNLHALQHGAQDHALRKGGEQRAKGKGAIPNPQPCCPRPIFKGHAAQDQPDEHRDKRRVNRRHDHGIGQWERRKQPATPQHQPGFIAIPNRRDGVDCGVAVIAAPQPWEQDANAEIEPIHHHIAKDGDGDNAGPDQRQRIVGGHCRYSAIAGAAVSGAPGTGNAAWVGSPRDGPASPGCGSCPISRTMNQVPTPNTVK